MQDCNYIYAMLFNAGGDSGIALVSARSDMDALQVLKNGGRFNSKPSTYNVLKYRNIGISTCLRTEILMEAYTNAEGVYDRLMATVDCLKGDKGDPGETTVVGAKQSDWNQTDNSQLDYIKNKPTIPSSLADLSSDSGHRTVTDAQISEWNAKSTFSGDYNDLTDKPALSEVATSGSYEDLRNKPTIPTVPTISTNIEADKLSDVKTASPKAVVTVTGSLSDLQTTDKSSLVAAINEAMQTGGSAEEAIIGISVPTPYDGTLIFTYGNGDTVTVDLNHSHPQYASKVEVANSIPAGGMLSNTQYNLGTLSGAVTFTLATPSDATIRNEYMFTFDTGSTALIPTWPSGITKWKGECVNSGTGQPEIATNKHYEVSLLNGYAYIAEI